MMKTQKAIGIFQGIPQFFNEYSYAYNFLAPMDHEYLSECINLTNDYIRYPIFARPCPKVPRHGFVESRVIYSSSEAKALIKEVLNQDPEGEVIYGPYLKNIRSSAVYVSSGLLSVGPGNDGATAGKHSISFPIASHKFYKGFLDTAGINDKSVYFETLHCPDSGCYLAQIRGGPEVSGTIKDYIPKEVVVKKIVCPTNNLLKWEKQVKTFDKGTIVYGKGFTLASHAAIHCVINGIPFVTSKKPKIGNVLKPTEGARVSIDRALFRKGVAAALKRVPYLEYKNDSNEDMQFCLTVLHNWPYLKWSEHASWILGAATTMFTKICTTLVCGEYRHVNGYNGGHEERDSVYINAATHTKKYANSLWSKCRQFYSRLWADCVGGVPWAICAWYSASIWDSIVKIYNKNSNEVSDAEVSEIIGLMNKTVNLEHNESWWFDKIMFEGGLNFAAESPGISALCVADIFYDFWKSVSAMRAKTDKLTTPIKGKLSFGKSAEGDLVLARVVHIIHENWEYDLQHDYCGEIFKEGHYSASFPILRKDHKHIRSEGVIPLAIIPDKGFRLPGGRIIKYKGIKKIK